MMRTCLRIVTISILCSIGSAIQCYECTAQLNYYDYYDPCLYGDQRYLRYVTCMEPSVCAAYHYQTEIPGTPTQISISRGCQALRFGATCEDIFNDLRKSGAVMPGQHTCATCSDDFCNVAGLNLVSGFVLVTCGVLVLISSL